MGKDDRRINKADAEVIKMLLWAIMLALSTDFLHWPEIHDELRKVGVEIVQL